MNHAGPFKIKSSHRPEIFLSCPGASQLADNIIGFRTSALHLPASDLI